MAQQGLRYWVGLRDFGIQQLRIGIKASSISGARPRAEDRSRRGEWKGRLLLHRLATLQIVGRRLWVISSSGHKRIYAGITSVLSLRRPLRNDSFHVSVSRKSLYNAMHGQAHNHGFFLD